MLSKINLNEVKEILYHHYKTDIVFPRSCGSVSMGLVLMMQNSHLSKEYQILYQRGHFRNDYEYEFCYCDMAEENFNRFSCLDNFNCRNCSCDYMVGHSWIELIDKSTNEITILDFTSIQFEEDFPDYQSEISENILDKEELYDYIFKRSKFVVHENDTRFKNYIKSERTYTGEYILNQTKEIIEENSVSSLTVLMDSLNYKI